LTLEFNYLVGFCAREPVLASKDNALAEGQKVLGVKGAERSSPIVLKDQAREK